MLRAVLDTNVWISAALSSKGAPAELAQRLLAQGKPVFSPPTYAELETRLWRPKFDRQLSMERRTRILRDLYSASLWVDIAPGPQQTYSRDADDDKFIHTALAAGAQWLVTGDQDLLLVPPIAGLSIITPAAALQLLLPNH